MLTLIVTKSGKVIELPTEMAYMLVSEHVEWAISVLRADAREACRALADLHRLAMTLVASE